MRLLDVEALTVSDVLGFPAAQLFIERATAASDGFKITDVDTRSVANICHRLDGIPLALELAAARVDVFGVRELAGQEHGRAIPLAVIRRERRDRQ